MLKKAKIAANIVMAKLLNQQKPLSVTYCTTNRCNLRCSYCSLPERKGDELSTHRVLTLIDEFRAAGVQRLGLAGGEPLLRNDIGTIINHAKEKDLFVSVTTNGTLITKRLDALKKLDIVLVSMDGPQAVHNLTGKENVEKLMANIHLLQKNGVNVATSTVLTKPTIDNLDFMFDVSKQMKLKLAFQPYSRIWYTSLAGNRSDALQPSLNEYKQAIRRIMDEKKKGALVTSSMSYLNLIKDGTNPQAKKCLAGKRYCYIDTNGDIYPCSPMTERIPAFNAVKLGFMNAFKKMHKFTCDEGCLFPCYLEYNFLFSLSWESLLNVYTALYKR